jgi:hypothetical protein
MGFSDVARVFDGRQPRAHGPQPSRASLPTFHRARKYKSKIRSFPSQLNSIRFRDTFHAPSTLLPYLSFTPSGRPKPASISKHTTIKLSVAISLASNSQNPLLKTKMRSAIAVGALAALAQADTSITLTVPGTPGPPPPFRPHPGTKLTGPQPSRPWSRCRRTPANR